MGVGAAIDGQPATRKERCFRVTSAMKHRHNEEYALFEARLDIRA